MENRSLIFSALVSILDRVRALMMMMMMMCRRTQKPSHIVPADVEEEVQFPTVSSWLQL